MSMKFTVAVSGDIRAAGIETSSVRDADAEDILNEEFAGAGGNVSFEDASILEATVVIEARVRINSVEVEASDIEDFDPENAIQDELSYDVVVTGAEFEVEDSPTGFDEVENATDRDTAITVYSALARAGYEVG